MPLKKSTIKKSPLHAAHEKLGAKMIPFSGWQMPVQYSGIIQEHLAVRQTVGMFDISHMGVFTVTGTKSESWLNTMLTNDIRGTAVGEGQYTLMLNEKGGVIDDLLAYRIEDQQFMLVVNAAKMQEGWDWLEAHLSSGVELINTGEDFAALAIQGPKSSELIEKVFPQQSILPRRNKVFFWEESDPPLWISRTGYTGEDGFELFFEAAAAEEVWDRFLNRMEALDGFPTGLGARDTLRLEAGLPLNGNDLSPEITPLEAGLKTFVNFDKPEKFIGSSVLRDQLESGVQRKAMAFKMKGKTPPPRAGYEIFVKDDKIGLVTSGAITPTLACGNGLALIDIAHAEPEQAIEVEIRGKRYPGHLAKKPLYRRKQ
ncbi:MAG: glycine cleavage system aminomethyltransferase GcvT [Verrucomicrobiota bacterium]